MQVQDLDLKTLTEEQLKELMQRATTVMAEKTVEQQEPLRQEFKELYARAEKFAQEVGLSVEDYLEISPVKLQKLVQNKLNEQQSIAHTPVAQKTKAKVEPKFKNPVTGDTWTGRGRKPVWVEEHLTQGGSLDELKIEKTEA